MLSRRKFLTLASGAAVAGSTGTAAALAQSLLRDSPASDTMVLPGATTTTSPITTTTSSEVAAGVFAPVEQRVLVLLDMSGGNDALNTLVTTDGLYYDARPEIAIAESELVTLDGLSDYGLHPGLAPMTQLWDNNQLALLASVGYDSVSRSHFEAQDWWFSAQPGTPATTGWLGRWLDATGDSEERNNPLRAVALGGQAGAITAKESKSTLISSPEAFRLFTPPGYSHEEIESAFLTTALPQSDIELVAAAQQAQLDTAEAIDLFAELSGDSPAGERRGRPGFPQSLSTAVNLIDSDAGTRIIVISAGGFDTHSNQLQTHQNLMSVMSEGITEFFAQLSGRGLSDRVALVATSEFGRRVAENSSRGTDHGRAGAVILAGAPFSSGLTGTYDLANLLEGDLAPQIDPRSVYRTCIDWMGGVEAEEILGASEDLGLLRAGAAA